MMLKMGKINEEFAKLERPMGAGHVLTAVSNATDYSLINGRKYKYAEKGSDSPHSNPQLTVPAARSAAAPAVGRMCGHSLAVELHEPACPKPAPRSGISGEPWDSLRGLNQFELGL